MKHLTLIISLVLLCVGCAADTKSSTTRPAVAATRTSSASALVITDERGQVIATGKLILPAVLPGEGGQFEGTWGLDSATKDFPSDAARPGEYRAEIYQGEAIIDLNPDTSDHNVMLTGKMSGRVLRGYCWLARYQGGKTIGSFTVNAADPHAH